MSEFIRRNFRGTTVTIAVTGLPVTLTGEVISTDQENVLGLRLENGNKVFIKSELIAFVF